MTISPLANVGPGLSCQWLVTGCKHAPRFPVGGFPYSPSSCFFWCFLMFFWETLRYLNLGTPNMWYIFQIPKDLRDVAESSFIIIHDDHGEKWKPRLPIARHALGSVGCSPSRGNLTVSNTAIWWMGHCWTWEPHSGCWFLVANHPHFWKQTATPNYSSFNVIGRL